MRMDQFTIKAQEALAGAQDIADRGGQQQIEKEHLLLALLGQEEGITRPILQKVGIDPALASPILVTTITDTFGYFIYLGLATLLLTRLI